MTINPKVWNFPTFSITKQLFHVPGAAMDGGFTSGGARIMSPEPGGFAMLNVEPAMQINETNYPLSSWLMSKTNGQILRIRLAPTPQIAIADLIRSAHIPWAQETTFNETSWDNNQNWESELTSTFVASSLVGSNVLHIDTTIIGENLKIGHVIGHAYDCYLIDEISFNGSVASLTVIPPLRRNVITGDTAYFRPWFTGMIANPTDIITTYDSENVGHIKLPMIILSEVVVP